MKSLALAVMAALTMIAAPASASDNAKEPVILINAFTVPAGKEAEAVRFWEEAAAFMKQQPGYLSTALHRAILPDARFRLINIARWESAEAFKNASRALRADSGIKPVDGVVPAPSLYEVIRSD